MILLPSIGGEIRLFLNTPTWITGLKIQQSEVKQLKIRYLQSRRQWNYNGQDIVSKIYSTASWEEIPKDVDPNGGIILPEGIVEPFWFKFVPTLADLIIISVEHSHTSNDETFIHELELYNDCKADIWLMC